MGKEDDVCTYEQTVNTPLFRGLEEESKQVQTDPGGARYVSSSYSRLVQPVISLSNSLRGRVILAQITKSIIAALLLVATIWLVFTRPELRYLATKILIVAFSVPYLIFTVASVYPAGIAILASIPFLLSLQALHTAQRETQPRTSSLLVVAGLSSGLIVSNRFEVTAFITLATILASFRSMIDENSRATRRAQILFACVFSTVLSIGVVTNPEQVKWIRNSLLGTAEVLDQGTVERNSKVVAAVGDKGLSIVAPATYVDNSSGESLNLIRGPLVDSSTGVKPLSNDTLARVVLSVSWFPQIAVLLLAARGQFKKNRSIKSFRTGIQAWGSVAVLLSALVVIPGFARAPAFFWYFAALLFALILFTDERTRWDSRLLRSASVVATATNVAAVWLANEGHGDLHIGGVILTPTQLTITTLVALISAAYFFLKLFEQGQRQR